MKKINWPEVGVYSFFIIIGGAGGAIISHLNNKLVVFPNAKSASLSTAGIGAIIGALSAWFILKKSKAYILGDNMPRILSLFAKAEARINQLQIENESLRREICSLMIKASGEESQDSKSAMSQLTFIPPRKDTPDAYICPITTMIINVPVYAPDGHAYERAALIEWYHRSPQPICPLIPSKVLGDPALLVIDGVLKEKIQNHILGLNNEMTRNTSTFNLHLSPYSMFRFAMGTLAIGSGYWYLKSRNGCVKPEAFSENKLGLTR